MTLRVLDPVVLSLDLPEHELCRGDLGAVVHVYSETAVDIEFVRASGQTQALVQLHPDAVRPLTDADVLTVRTVAAQRGAA